MQTASMLRTTAPASASRCHRPVVQAKLVPAALRRGRTVQTRAEADNTGGSITNSGKTKGKDSYEVRTDDLLAYVCACCCVLRCNSHIVTLHWYMDDCTSFASLAYRKLSNDTACVFRLPRSLRAKLQLFEFILVFTAEN